MVGWGKGSPDQPQNMAASCPSPPAPCNVSNLLVDKPNPHVLLGAIPQFETFSDKLDDLRTLNDTRVSLSSSIGFAAMAYRAMASSRRRLTSERPPAHEGLLLPREQQQQQLSCDS